MHRQRVKLEVEVDLDPVPGTFHTEESAREQIHYILLSSIPHYHPRVLIDDRP
jgi:hypothetical protein